VLRLLIIGQESKALAGLCLGLRRNNFACSILPYGDGLVEQVAVRLPDLLLVETDGYLVNSRIRELAQRIKQTRPLPIIAVVAEEKLGGIDEDLDVDDFIISPCDARELTLRIKRLVHKTGEPDGQIIRCDGLIIDPARCEVSIEGRVIELTFKEYELLKFLAGNRGRVYTREDLLNRVWGYDYYGGDRTVDVHVRRLRSKIEDAQHTFIETVRNIGYRFRNLPQCNRNLTRL
jgi:two-component system alkaline phosphatase synthesis response regulator PhoP